MDPQSCGSRLGTLAGRFPVPASMPACPLWCRGPQRQRNHLGSAAILASTHCTSAVKILGGEPRLNGRACSSKSSPTVAGHWVSNKHITSMSLGHAHSLATASVRNTALAHCRRSHSVPLGETGRLSAFTSLAGNSLESPQNG